VHEKIVPRIKSSLMTLMSTRNVISSFKGSCPGMKTIEKILKRVDMRYIWF